MMHSGFLYLFYCVEIDDEKTYFFWYKKAREFYFNSFCNSKSIGGFHFWKGFFNFHISVPNVSLEGWGDIKVEYEKNNMIFGDFNPVFDECSLCNEGNHIKLKDENDYIRHLKYAHGIKL